MAIVIIAVTIILYVILLGFTWHNLGKVDNKIKIATILIGMIVMALLTLITFNVSASSIEYPNKQMISSMRNMLVAVFTPVNGLIVMPYLANALSKIKTEEITKKGLQTRIVILAVIFVVLLIIECSYLEDMQTGILEIMNNL